jgi:hypothetical protein
MDSFQLPSPRNDFESTIPFNTEETQPLTPLQPISPLHIPVTPPAQQNDLKRKM